MTFEQAKAAITAMVRAKVNQSEQCDYEKSSLVKVFSLVKEVFVQKESGKSLAPTISTGTSAPAAAPTAVGQVYVDTTAKKPYIGCGTSAAGDFFAPAPAPVVGTSAPAAAPAAAGLFYVDTTNKKAYISVGTSASTDWVEITNVAED